jgi:cytochrome c5
VNQPTKSVTHEMTTVKLGSMKETIMRAVAIGFLILGAVTMADQAIALDGAAIYASNCAVCHNNLNPKLGDKAAWAPRIAQGEDALVAAVIQGKGMMRPRAGKPSLSDDEIKAAVEYIESESK